MIEEAAIISKLLEEIYPSKSKPTVNSSLSFDSITWSETLTLVEGDLQSQLLLDGLATYMVRPAFGDGIFNQVSCSFELVSLEFCRNRKVELSSDGCYGALTAFLEYQTKDPVLNAQLVISDNHYSRVQDYLRNLPDSSRLNFSFSVMRRNESDKYLPIVGFKFFSKSRTLEGKE